jgi:DTW domain-containing protein YfiP
MREVCARCRRPEGFCQCAGPAALPSRTRVVLLQHPREARMAICSARMTRLALANAELHRGVRFEDHARVRELLALPGTALLFPGEGARPAAERAEAPPGHLVVIDGTWLQAVKMLRDNPALAALPRLSVSSPRPSGYGALRREPAPHTLSTIEAVALALGELERDPARFAPMAEAFRRVVEAQLACARGDRRRPRHRGGQSP